MCYFESMNCVCVCVCACMHACVHACVCVWSMHANHVSGIIQVHHHHHHHHHLVSHGQTLMTLSTLPSSMVDGRNPLEIPLSASSRSTNVRDCPPMLLLPCSDSYKIKLCMTSFLCLQQWPLSLRRLSCSVVVIFGSPLCRTSFRRFPIRMVYLYYTSCLRYTILVGNPRNFVACCCQVMFFTTHSIFM